VSVLADTVYMTGPQYRAACPTAVAALDRLPRFDPRLTLTGGRDTAERIGSVATPEISSSDGGFRVAQFLARHGGPGSIGEREGQDEDGTRGWSEVYAADGYALRCEWSRMGAKTELQYSEVPPR